VSVGVASHYIHSIAQVYKFVNTQTIAIPIFVSNWPAYGIDKLITACYNGNMNTIKDFMRERGYTQAELAEKLGYSQAHIANLANGKDMVSDKFRWRWVEVFGPASLKVLDDNHEAA
jgi:antitoxin component HigA of HigAB toxin-antitoxin module